MSVDDSGANRLPDEYHRLVDLPRPYAVTEQPATRNRLLARLMRTAGRRRAEPGATAKQAPEPPGGVPPALIDALRGHHDLCRIAIGGVILSVAFTAGHMHHPNPAREIAAWAAILRVFRIISAGGPPPGGVYTCAAALTDQTRPPLPAGVDAIAWQQDTAYVYAAKPGCPRRALRRIRPGGNPKPRHLAAAALGLR